MRYKGITKLYINYSYPESERAKYQDKYNSKKYEAYMKKKRANVRFFMLTGAPIITSIIFMACQKSFANLINININNRLNEPTNNLLGDGNKESSFIGLFFANNNGPRFWKYIIFILSCIFILLNLFSLDNIIIFLTKINLYWILYFLVFLTILKMLYNIIFIFFLAFFSNNNTYKVSSKLPTFLNN